MLTGSASRLMERKSGVTPTTSTSWSLLTSLRPTGFSLPHKRCARLAETMVTLRLRSCSSKSRPSRSPTARVWKYPGLMKRTLVEGSSTRGRVSCSLPTISIQVSPMRGRADASDALCTPGMAAAFSSTRWKTAACAAGLGYLVERNRLGRSGKKIPLVVGAAEVMGERVERGGRVVIRVYGNRNETDVGVAIHLR